MSTSSAEACNGPPLQDQQHAAAANCSRVQCIGCHVGVLDAAHCPHTLCFISAHVYAHGQTPTHPSACTPARHTHVVGGSCKPMRHAAIHTRARPPLHTPCQATPTPTHPHPHPRPRTQRLNWVFVAPVCLHACVHVVAAVCARPSVGVNLHAVLGGPGGGGHTHCGRSQLVRHLRGDGGGRWERSVAHSAACHTSACAPLTPNVYSCPVGGGVGVGGS